MKRSFFGSGVVVLSFVLALAGCGGGGGGGGTNTVIAQTLSDVRADGDIGFSAPPPIGGTFSFSQASVAGGRLPLLAKPFLPAMLLRKVREVLDLQGDFSI